MPRKPAVARNIALCYIRKSWTRDEKDAISPERQKINIQAVCEANGWVPEWYEDTEGHKSGMHEKNRPEWLRLKARLGDPDVAALVANDLARLHRKGWRVGDLLDYVDQHGVKLIVADPQRQMDFSTPQGRIVAQLSAIFDEYYAVDVSMRRKADIAHRKSKGITVGLPPFGTKRDKKTGFLVKSDEGVWLLPDGSWVAGRVDEAAPVEGAIWRGYADCAERMLNLYINQGKRGGLARILQDEGWAFRDRNGDPAPIEKDDIRRVVANWAEYGGYVSKKRARERHPSDYPPDEIIAKLKPERAVFPIELLAQVAHTRRQRAIGKNPSRGVNRKAHAYPLGGIVYCAHCHRMAEANNNPKLRSFLSGRLGKYYRHKPGGACGCGTQSVQRGVLEDQFYTIIQSLEIRPETIEKMSRLAVQLNSIGAEQKDLEKEKAEAIALCRRRIDAAIHLYGDGRISREEYQRRVENNESEIALWETRTTESERIAMEFTACVNAIEMINRLWDISEDEDKQGMARQLFEYLVFDLDKKQIVDFRLKGWANQFLIARVGVLMDEDNEKDDNDNPMTPTGLELLGRSLREVVAWLLEVGGFRRTAQRSRNELIRLRYAAGESISELARAFGISPQRVHQIINFKGK